MLQLDNSTPQDLTDKKEQSESLAEGLDTSASNPVQSPEEILEPVANVERAPANYSDEDLQDAFSSIEEAPLKQQPKLRDSDIQDAFDYVEAAPAAALDRSRTLSRREDVDKNAQLRDIQETYKVSADQAMAMLTQTPYSELKVKNKYTNLVNDYPSTSKWAQNPANLKLMDKNPDAFKKIEESTKMLGAFGDYGKVFKQNVYGLPMMGLYAAVAAGTVSIEDAEPLMTKYQDAIEANQIVTNKKGMTELGQGIENMASGLGKIFPYKFSDKKGNVTIDSLSKIAARIDKAANDKDFSFLTRAYKRYQTTDTGILDFLGAAITNRQASILMAGQSANSMVPGFAATITGTAVGGLVAGPIGATVGGLGAAATAGFATNYAAFFQDEADKFRDEKTGKIDFKKMYSDKNALAKMNASAIKYASAHAVFEAIGGKLLGKTFAGAKNASKAVKGGALIVETAEQMAAEFGGELSGQLAKGETVGTALSQAIPEGLMSLPYTPGAAVLQAVNLARIKKKANDKKGPSGPTGTPPTGTPPAAKPPTQKVFKNSQQLFKVIGEKLEATKATANKEILTEMRNDKQASPVLKEAPQQVQDLIKETANPTVEVGEDADGTIIQENIGEDMPMSFDVDQFEALAESVGEPPLKMAEHLGPNGVAAYIAAKKGDTGSFQVTHDEYHRYSDARPELDDIVYVGGAEMNATEGAQTTEAVKELEQLILDSEDITNFDDEVYHGSPFEFDTFSTDKINTGEGAQAFGYGLYFTESEAIAKYYKEGLSRLKGTKGRLFKAEIPTSNAMLDWNTPVSKMEPYVQKQLAKAGIDVEVITASSFDYGTLYKNKELEKMLKKEDYFSLLDNYNLDEMDAIERHRAAVNVIARELKGSSIQDFISNMDILDPAQVKLLTEAFTPKLESITGKGLYQSLAKKHSPKQASKILSDAGIPGIKYKAEGGRSGKNNFVVFSDDLVKVVSFEDNAGNEPPPIPGQDFQVGPDTDTFTTYVPTSGDESLGDNISRPVELLQAGRSKEQKKVFSSILGKIKGALKITGINEEVSTLMAELEFSHQRYRSEVTGKSISDLQEDRKVGYYTDPKKVAKAYGTMSLVAGLDNPKTAIAFSPNADALTVVHEFAHAWLHDMVMDFEALNSNLTRTEAQQSYYDAMLETAKIFEIDDIANLYKRPEGEYRKIHETFAQTAEEFFLENKHQNSSMRRVFSKMKQWIVETANLARRLTRSYPTLKITPEIERIFNTILDANSEAEERTEAMFPDPLFTEQMLGDKAAKYREAELQARDQAVAKMYSGFFNGSLRERETKINEALNEINDQATNEVNNLPSMILQDLIKARGADGKITYQSIFEALANSDTEIMEQIKGILAPGTMAPAKRRGVDVREVMNAMGINDPKEFVSILAQMKERYNLIEKRANELMDTMFPPLKTDAEMHAEAVKSIQESGKEKLLGLQMQILTEQSLKTVQGLGEATVKSPLNLKRKTIKDLKVIASARAMAMDVSKFSANFFLKEATRFNKKAASQVKQSDFMAALDSKQKEAVNTFAYLQSLEIEKDLSKIKINIKKLLALKPKDIGKNYDFEIYTAAKEFASEFANNQSLSDPSEVAGFNKMTPANQAILTDMINDINADKDSRPEGSVSVESMLKLGRIIEVMKKEARTAKEIELANIKYNIDEARAEIITDLTKQKGVLAFGGSLRYAWRSSLVTVDNLFAGMMSEKDYAGSKILQLIQRIRLQQNEVIQARNADFKKISDALKEVNRNNPKARSLSWILKSNAFAAFGLDAGMPTQAPEINHTFQNDGEKLKFAMIYMSEDGRRKLAEGGIQTKDKKRSGPLSTEKVDLLMDNMIKDGRLTKAELDLAQTILDVFESHFLKVQEVANTVLGHPLNKVEARPLSTPWGEYKGGYFPLSAGKTDSETLIKMLQSPDGDAQFVKNYFAATNKSMTKDRSANADYPVDLNLSTLTSQLGAVHRLAYLLPVMTDANKIFGGKSFINMMEERRPGAMKNIVEPFLKKTMAQQHIVRADAEQFRALEKVVNLLTNRARKSIFFLNYITWGKQYIGLFPAMKELSAARISMATAKSVSSWSKTRGMIMGASPLMKERFATNSKNIIKSIEDFSMNNTLVEKLDEASTNLTYFPIQLAQNHVDTIVWTAAYDTATLDLKLGEKEAIAYADSFVIRTQTSNNVPDIPAIRSGTVFKRMFTTFSNVPVGMAGMQLEARGRGKEVSNTKMLAMMANAYLFTALLPGIFSAMVSKPGAGFKAIGGDDEDKEEYFEELQQRAVGETIDSILPVTASNVAALFGGYGGNIRYAQFGVVPLSNQILQGAKGTAAGASRLRNVLTDGEEGIDELSGKDIQSLMIAFSLATGIPSAEIPFTLKRIDRTIPDSELEEAFNDLDLTE